VTRVMEAARLASATGRWVRLEEIEGA
jgi:hypothetical protein